MTGIELLSVVALLEDLPESGLVRWSGRHSGRELGSRRLRSRVLR
jgi:hypothetical protein